MVFAAAAFLSFAHLSKKYFNSSRRRRRRMKMIFCAEELFFCVQRPQTKVKQAKSTTDSLC